MWSCWIFPGHNPASAQKLHEVGLIAPGCLLGWYSHCCHTLDIYEKRLCG